MWGQERGDPTKGRSGWSKVTGPSVERSHLPGGGSKEWIKKGERYQAEFLGEGSHGGESMSGQGKTTRVIV